MQFIMILLLQVLFLLPGKAEGNAGDKLVNDQSKRVSIVCKHRELRWVIKQLEEQSGLHFVYSDDDLQPNRSVTLRVRNSKLQEALSAIFQPLDIAFEITGNNILLKSQNAQPPSGKKIHTVGAIAAAEIKGKVTDESGNPVEGASVTLKETNISTITNAAGEFSLTVNAVNGTLLVSFVGFKTQEVPVSDNMLVKLVPADNRLSEVVVVGYGTQRKASLTGAVDQIKPAALEGRANGFLTQSLQGASPNLIIQQTNSEPGARPTLNIRGVSTLGNNEPLVVIDGIAGGDLNLLNPSDIESISVLKDAGSAAIYGSRSANGVLLITTKKGRKNAGMAVNYNGIVGVQQPKVWYRPVESYENATLRNDANVNAGLAPIYSPDQIRDFYEKGSEPWFLDEILQPAVQQNHNISVSGGNANTTYLVSAGYVNQGNNLVGPGFGMNRYNYRINVTTEAGRLKLTGTLAYTRNQIKEHSSTTQTLIVDAGRVPTYYRLKDEEGRYLTNDVLAEFNPLGILEQGGYRKYDDDNIFGNISADLDIYKGLKLRGVVGGTLTANHMFEFRRQVNFYPKGVYGPDRNANDRTNKNLFLNTQLMLDYSTNISNHRINALVGIANESVTDQTTEVKKKYVDNDLGTPTTGTVIDPGTINSVNGTYESSLNSLFGRLGYNYSDKYYVEANFRVDGSSKFNRDNRWGFFPSIAASWMLSDESFMSGYADRMGTLKLRASYGILGNQNVGNYQFQTTYSNYNNAYGFNNVALSGTGFTFANPDLRWERAATFNAGVDAAFFQNRLQVNFDYFDKLTSDILIAPAIPGLYGASISDYNAGKVRNQGWELNVNYRLPGSRNFKHNAGFNIGDSRNKVVYFEGNERISGADEMQYILKEGLPFNSYIGLKTNGYFQNLDEVINDPRPVGVEVMPGDLRFVDRNKDGIINDEDRFVLGHPFPRFTYGLNYNASYKNFDFYVFFQGVGKRDMFLRGELVEPFHYNYGQVMYQHQLDYWTPLNPDARFPRLASNGSASNTNNFRRGSDVYLFNAAYLRLKNIQLGYNFANAWVQKAGLQKLRLYAVAQNLFTVSKMDFLDPEISEFNGSLKNAGANSGRSYPTPVFYGIGLDVNFK
ncbi:MAG: TonB-dependent receptor [Chitinophagaceae bacterium]|nr:TonB-dependent receptor [Chitinophagaceae bacterium]